MIGVAELAATVQKACRSGTWSLGVNLARAGGVVVESRAPDEVVLRVRSPGRPVALTVVLYPGAADWECDCPSRLNPCEHVAAAVISLGQAEVEAEGGQAKPVPAASAAWEHVAYRFTREAAGLHLERAIVRGEGDPERPLTTTLSGLLARPAEAAGLHPEEADLRADLLLEPRTRAGSVLPAEKLRALLQILVGSPRVRLGGRPVAVSDEEVLPRAVVEDRGADVVVSVTRDPGVTAVVSPGVALCGDTLRPLGETELGGLWLQNLPAERRYAPRELGELVARVLPDLMKRVPVEVRSHRLPGLVRDLRPRIALDVAQLGGGLSVLPTLVYGAPACARIDDGRMVHLGGAVPVRDPPAERRLVDQLRAELGLLPGRRTTFQGADAARFAGQLRTWRGELAGDGAALVRADLRLVPLLTLAGAAAAEPAGDAPSVRFDLRFAVEGGATGSGGEEPARTVDGEAVIRAWRDGLGLVPLDGGGWAPLPDAWLAQHGQKVLDLLLARDGDGRLARHALPSLAALCEDLDHPAPPGLARLAPLVQGFEGLPEPDLPGDLAATLRPYQRQGVAWLAFLRRAGLGGVLADDMGLGKTLQALCVVAAAPTAEPAGTSGEDTPREGTPRAGTLVVCPTSLVHNWAAEARRFRPGLRVSLYHGPSRALDPAADLTVTSYALLRLDSEKLCEPLWDAVILDEAQAVKNPDSQVTRAAYTLRADFRLALTGTPLENRLDELWSLLHFTNRGLLGGRADFDDRYGRPVAAGDAAAAAALRQRVRPFVLRRLKRDVAPELPPRTESVILVDLDAEERAVYDAVHAASRADVIAALGRGSVAAAGDEGREGGGGGGGGGGGSMLRALEALLRLRQAACHPALVPGQAAPAGEAAPPPSSKVEALVDALGTAVADGHRALIFSQWTSLLDLIEPALTAAAISFARLDGATRDRAAVTERFQAADGPPVMLVSLKAGGTGLNLTAADHVFLCDPWWNPAVEAQAADRAHRIGQERPVMVYRLVSVGTVEERILALQERKRSLVDAALGEGGVPAALTRDDLLALLA